jgi:hypothetical protein
MGCVPLSYAAALQFVAQREVRCRRAEVGCRRRLCRVLRIKRGLTCLAFAVLWVRRLNQLSLQIQITFSGNLLYTFNIALLLSRNILSMMLSLPQLLACWASSERGLTCIRR